MDVVRVNNNLRKLGAKKWWRGRKKGRCEGKSLRKLRPELCCGVRDICSPYQLLRHFFYGFREGSNF